VSIEPPTPPHHPRDLRDAAVVAYLAARRLLGVRPAFTARDSLLDRHAQMAA
jgi:hypothetical protein